jgi:peptide/nickel transport system substrate-binding protein
LRLTEPDPNLLFKLAVPFGSVVPAGSSAVDLDRRRPLPGTGPYRIERFVGNKTLELARNPRFREWSRQAQPAGFPDRIVYTFDVPPERAATQVERGRSDVMLAQSPLRVGRLVEVFRRFPTQAHPFAVTATRFAFLDTRESPFDDLRVRRALNYATDRAAILGLWGGPKVEHLTCQVLPPGLQGYTPYCPYTAGDERSGVWTAPDLPRARALLEEADAGGSDVTVAASADDPPRLATARYFVRLLKRLGFRPSLRVYPNLPAFYTQAGKPRADIQLGNQGWVSDVPRASDFFLNLLTCSSYDPAADPNLNAAGFCSPSVDRMVERAEQLDATDPTAAGRLWARADREVTDASPWISYLNPIGLDLVSERVGNYQRNPQYGALLSQLWVR